MLKIPEFWENRVFASNMEAAETRIPNHPDQTEFLDIWYEFHQGYRIHKREDGSEHRVPLLGEPFKDVSPGYLPRTLDELRNGRVPPQNPFVQASDSATRETNTDEQSRGQMNLEDALDQMLEQVEADETQQADVHRQSLQESASVARDRSDNRQSAANSQYQARRVAALRRELFRMRTGVERVISGLRELGEDVDSWRADGLAYLGRTLDDISTVPSLQQPSSLRDRSHSMAQANPTGASQNPQSMYAQTHGPLANLQFRLDQANSRLEQARRARERAADELEASESEVQASREWVRSLQREQSTAENYIRIFGTREEMEHAGADYESPIGGMFNRAWNRYRVAEEVRREERNLREVLRGEERVLEIEGPTQAQLMEPSGTMDESNASRVDGEALRRFYAELRMRDETQGSLSNITGVMEALEESRLRIRARSTQLLEASAQATQQQPFSASSVSFPQAAARRAWLHRGQHEAIVENESSDSEKEGPRGLDREDDGRPPPKNDDEMTVKLDCKICYQQVADTIVLPCGHLVMCEWCSLQHVPCHDHDRTRPKRPTDCPLCRKRIKQKVWSNPIMRLQNIANSANALGESRDLRQR